MERGITKSDQGFTLIEMVIVVAVIAIMSITAVFSVGRGGSQAQADVTRFRASYDSLREVAILSRRARAISLDATGWQMLEPPRDSEADERWAALGARKNFRGEARFQGPSGTIGRVVAGTNPKADLIFLPDGQVTPFEVSFISADRVTRCTGSGWEGMTCEGQ